MSEKESAIPPPAETGEPGIALIAIDLDGTLLTSDKRLSKRAVEAITRCAAQGVRVVIASARPPRSVREVYGILGLDTFQINYNGALIHDPPRNAHVFHQPIEAALAQRIVRAARGVDPDVAVSVEILDRWCTDRIDPAFETETSKAFKPDFIGDAEAFLCEPITKIMLLAPPERLVPIRRDIAAKFGSEVTLLVSDDFLLQIVHREVDKAVALDWVAKSYGIDPANIMAIGDAPNDVGMLRYAGLGVAVDNAWEAARAAADAIVPANDADGVTHALHHFVLDRL